jgi:single-stranded-DNA-specific exonuclease
LPPALAVINPKQAGDAYPDKNLAGVGIAYKIAQALIGCRPSASGLQPTDLLDLVALGTVADLAPLTGENRFLVRSGLRQIRETKRQGLFPLANGRNGDRQDRQPDRLHPGTAIECGRPPRIGLAAFDLLTTTDFMLVVAAQQLDQQNRQRQQLARDAGLPTRWQSPRKRPFR